MKEALERARNEMIVAVLKFVGFGFVTGCAIGGLIYFFSASPARVDLAIFLSSVPVVFVIAYAAPVVKRIWQISKAIDRGDM